MVRIRPLLSVLFLLLLSVSAIPCEAGSAGLEEQVADSLRLALPVSSDTGRLTSGFLDVELLDSLGEFYRKRNYQPAWITDRGLSDQAVRMARVLKASAREGLNPEDYRQELIFSLIRMARNSRQFGLLYDPRRMAELDLLLTEAFLRYASHLTAGRVDPARVHDGEWKARPGKADVLQILRFSLERGDVDSALLRMLPPYKGYQRLREAYAGYHRIAEEGGWPLIPDGPLVGSGMADDRVPLLRERLAITGDLPNVPETEGRVLDRDTAAALRRFQERHGLNADGIMGPDTLAELNVPVETRIRQIELNLERWRWLPKDLGRRHILVNIADFSLEVIEDGNPVMEMPVVVGTAYRRTPVFSGTMSYLEFAPTWGVPPTIFRKDKFPLIKSDPSYLERNHYEIVAWGSANRLIRPDEIDWSSVDSENFPGMLRQKPGPWNALGRVKFMFPNDFNVYLHDTPERHHFRRDFRSYSSGCIRLERPLDLAQYLLGEEGWSCERLISLMNGRTPMEIGLERPIPVHILYWTAWVDRTGRVQFRKDLYFRDIDLDHALKGRKPPREFQADAGEGSGAV